MVTLGAHALCSQQSGAELKGCAWWPLAVLRLTCIPTHRYHSGGNNIIFLPSQGGLARVHDLEIRQVTLPSSRHLPAAAAAVLTVTDNNNNNLHIYADVFLRASRLQWKERYIPQFLGKFH